MESENSMDLNAPISTYNATTATPAKVVPLLQSLSRAEDLVSSLAIRLDPIVQHVPSEAKDVPTSNTVTNRINSLGDALQYLLDHIEL